MIKFFRHIRRHLLTDKAGNNFSKYLFYAIGEIILVVIGILIALQINTWNNERETRSLEVKIIKELRSNLLLDLEEIREDIDLMNAISKSSSKVYTYIATSEYAVDSLQYYASQLRTTPHFDPNLSGYDFLVSKGIGIISNDSLRNDISVHYERLYPYYRRYEEERIRFHALHSEPVLIDYFEMEFDTTEVHYNRFKISQYDYDRLKMDNQFKKVVKAIAFENSGVQNRAMRVEDNILTLLDKLNAALEELQTE